MKLTLYTSTGKVLFDIIPDASASQDWSLMSDNKLSVTFELETCVNLSPRCYVDFDGTRFYLLEEYKPTLVNSARWKYNVTFKDAASWMGITLALNLIDGQNTPIFNYTAPAVEHAAIIVANLNRRMNTTEWKVGSVINTENITIEYRGKYCADVLQEITDGQQTEWWLDGMTLNIGRAEFGDIVELGYRNGLLGDIMCQQADNMRTYAYLYPVGSTRNIDPTKYGYDRLQLPDGQARVDMNVEQGVAELVEENAFAHIYPRYEGTVQSVRSRETIGNDGREFTIYYIGDILPFNPNDYEIAGLVHITFLSGELMGQDFEVNYDAEAQEFEIITQWPNGDDMQLPGGLLTPEVGNKYVIWNITMPDVYYTLASQELLEAAEAFAASAIQDVSIYKAKTNYIDIQDRNIFLRPGQRVRLYSEQYFPESGYYDSRVTRVTRNLLNPYALNIDISAVRVVGSISRLQSSVSKTETQVNKLSGALPTIIKSGEETTASDSSVYTSAKSEKEFLNRRKGGSVIGRVDFMTAPGFPAGADFNGAKITYNAVKDAFVLSANLIVEKEVAWNSSLEGFDVPTIMGAVVVDNVTITKENGVLTVIGGTGGGVADSVAWSNVTGKPTTLAGYGITDAYTKAETNTAIDTRINAVVAGAPANYDTLKEIADVLAGNVNSIGDIMSVLSTKWTQDDSLIANWNTAYSWGNHAGKYLPISGKAADSALLNGQGLADVNGRNGIPVSSSGGYMEVGMAVDFHRYEDGADFSTRLRVANGNFGNIVWLPTADGTIALTSDITNALASYVTLGTNQDVTGVKNFINGIKIGGVSVTYNAEKKAFVFPANAIFEGEVAWNSSVEGFDVQTITDAVQVDGTTIAKVDGVLKVVGGAGGGLDETQLAQYLTANNYAKKGDITTALQPYALATAIPTNNNQLTNGAGYITASALGGYATQEWVNNKGYISGISSSMVTTALGYTPYNASNFTKANIKSTLGISDWALASSKPTYNWSEIDSRPTALSQFSNDSGYITSAALSPYALSASLANYLPISGGTLNGALTAASTISANSVIASTGRWRVNASDSTNNFGYMRAETYSSNRGLVHIGSNYGGQSNITSASADVDAIGIYRSVVGVGRTFSGQELYDFYNSGVKLAVVGGANISRFLQANEQIAAQFYYSNIAKSTGANTSGYFRWGAFDEVGGLKLQFGADSGCKFEIVNKAWNLGLFSVDTAGNVTASGEIAWNSSRVLKHILNGRPTYLTMSEMLKIRPYRYTWKDGRDKKIHAGGIADEVLEVLPEVILTDSKGIHSMDYGQAAFTVATSLTPYVSRHEREIKALRRKVRELEALRRKVRELEAEINRLTK